MTGDRSSSFDIFRAGTRWPWLIFLPLYFVPWFWVTPAPGALAAGVAGVGGVLVLFLRARGWAGRARAGAALGVLALSFLLALAGGIWAVASIYAAAIAGELRPARRAETMIALFVLAAAGFAIAFGQPLLWWGPGVFMMGVVGLASVATTALEDKNRALVNGREEVRQLAVAAERVRIARDLHDLLGRTLTLVTIKANLAAKLVSRDSSAAEREMREVAQAARAALAEVRAAVAGMTDANLRRELERAKTALAAAGIKCSVDGDSRQVDPQTGAVLAMVLREAVTNVIRHSGAETCHVAIGRAGANECVTVVDDGKGDIGGSDGTGLTGLRSRLEAAGGAITIQSDDNGTRLAATLPPARNWPSAAART